MTVPIQELIGEAILILILKFVTQYTTNVCIILAVLFPAFLRFPGLSMTNFTFILFWTFLVPFTFLKLHVSKAT